MKYLFRFWVLAKPIRTKILLGMLCTTLAATSTLFIPYLLGAIVHQSLKANTSILIIVSAAGIVAAVGIFEAVMLFVRRLLMAGSATRLERSMRFEFFAKLMRLSLDFHKNWQQGQLLSRVMSDLGLIRRWIGFGLIVIVADVVMITVGIALMWAASWKIALVYTVFSVPMIFIVWRFTVRFTDISRLGQSQAGDLAMSVEESVHGLRAIKALGRVHYTFMVYSRFAQKVKATETKKGAMLARFSALNVFIPEIALAFCLLFGIFEISEGRLNVAGLAAFFTMAMILSSPLAVLGQLLGMTSTTVAALSRYFEVLDTKESIVDLEGSSDLELKGAAPVIEFVNVGFSYQDAGEQIIFDGLNLKVPAGSSVAIVGGIGSGKTTLLYLLLRFIDADRGEVKIDGKDVKQIKMASLRSACAVAFEDATLFSGSVRANVLLGVDPALSEEEKEEILQNALFVADCEFVENLPGGVDCHIGEEGMSLSGGQRQRLALARAVARNPKILLLDDPLSALDTETEARVMQRLRKSLQSSTSLIVAHRASTVSLADCVAFVDGGKVQDVGTHAELLARNKQYAYVMADMQEQRMNLQEVVDTAAISIFDIKNHADYKKSKKKDPKDSKKSPPEDNKAGSEKDGSEGETA